VLEGNVAHFALLALLFSVFLVSCNGNEEQPVDASATPSGDLAIVPRPSLEGLAPAAREQITVELDELDVELEGGAEGEDLAGRFGRVGRLYHAYGLLEPAAAAYGNAATLDRSDFRWHYMIGVIAETRGDGEGAEASLRRSLDLQPEHAAASIRLADLLLVQNRWTEAEPYYEALLQSGTEPGAALYGLAQVATEAGDHQLAVEHFEALLEREPGFSSVYYLLGQAYRQLGEVEKAETNIARRGAEPVTYSDPLVDSLADLVTGVGVPIERALEAFGTGDYLAAAAQYGKALEIDPVNATALRGRALSYRQAGEFERASVDFERMLELYPDHQLARLDYGTALLDAGQPDRSVAQLAEAVRRDPDFKEAHFNLGVGQIRLELWSDAVDSFGSVVEIDPRNVAAYYHLGMSLDESGRGAEAVAALESALAIAPDHVAARQRLALVRQQVEGDGAAVETFEELLTREGVPPQERALALFQLGRIAAGAGDVETAEKRYREAVQLFPDLWQARFNLANLLDRVGRTKEAAVELAGLLARDPENVVARVREAEILSSLGEWGIARARLEEGLTLVSNSSELAHALARILVTAPDPVLRDGERALVLAQGAFSALQSVEHAETVSMALAEVGRFGEAIFWQEEAIAQARGSNDEAALERLGRRLVALRAGQALSGEKP